jgi:molybdate transport system substrate-binding protein
MVMVNFLVSRGRWLPFLLFAILLGCSSRAAEPGTAELSSDRQLVIFSAASLTEAFRALSEAFEAEQPGVEIILNFAGSQQLAQQLGQGAPADLFASANERQMTAVIDTGRVVAGSQQIFAANRLVIVYPSENPGDLQTISDLARPGLRLLLAAPEVPVGQYAQEFLDKTAAEPAYGPDFAAGARSNVVSFEENVRAVLSKIVLGEADGGIVYQSDLKAETANLLGQLPIPDELNIIASYPIAPISDSGQPALAAAFLDFVLSPAGQAVLAAHGFGRPI